jgi:polysaccharide biosynthesis transport protein
MNLPLEGDAQTGTTLSGDRHSAQITESALAELSTILIRRRFVIIASLIVCLVAAVIVQVFARRSFQSTAEIKISQDENSQTSLDQASSQVMGLGGDNDVRLATEVLILQSKSLDLAVAKDLSLARNPLFSMPGKAEGLVDLNNPVTRERVLDAMKASIKVARVPHTNAIDITVRTHSAKLSTDIANALVNEYIKMSYTSRYQTQANVSDWLSKQLDDLRNQTENAQQTMLNLQRKLGLLAMVPMETNREGGGESGGAPSLLAMRVGNLQTSLSAAEADRIVKEGQYQVAQGASPSLIDDPKMSSPLNSLRQARDATKNELQHAEVLFGPNYPHVKELRAELAQMNSSIAQEEKTVLERYRLQAVAAEKNEADLKAELDKAQGDTDKLTDDLVKYTIAKREFESSYEIYEGILRRLKEAGVLASLRASGVDIVDPAFIPIAPSFPKFPIVLGGGLAAGVLLGLIAAFVFEGIDQGLHSVEDFEAESGLPVLAVVPTSKSRRKGTEDQAAEGAAAGGPILPILLAPKTQFAEAFRTLRSSLLMTVAGNPPQVIVVTSAVPAEGKSTTALNLSVTLSQKGVKVLLIDTDLRRPSLHVLFRVPAVPGLANLLTGQSSFEECVRHVAGVPSLDLLPCGPIPPMPSELLGSKQFRELIAELRKIYDHIVIDTAPVIAVSDSTSLSSLADGAIVVSSPGTRRSLLRRACIILMRSGMPLIGGVLNRVDILQGGYYGYRSYYGSEE